MAAAAVVSAQTGQDWSPGDCGTWAFEKCSRCHGNGWFWARKHKHVCNCVYRNCFRMVISRYRYCCSGPGKVVHQIHKSGKRSYVLCGRPWQEYCADVELHSYRNLENSTERQVFDHHIVWQQEWRQCCDAIGVDRGTFFHMVYRIEQRLGRVFRELRPYSLLPGEYFSGGRQISIMEQVSCKTPAAGTNGDTTKRKEWIYLGENEREQCQTDKAHPWRRKKEGEHVHERAA